MAQAQRAKRGRRVPPMAIKQADWRQHLIAVGVIEHPAIEHYQVWLPARGQIAMLLAFRTLEQADAAKQAVGEALVCHARCYWCAERCGAGRRAGLGLRHHPVEHPWS